MNYIIERFEDQEVRFVEVDGEKLSSVQDVLKMIGKQETREYWRKLKKEVELIHGEVKQADIFYHSSNRFYKVDVLNEDQMLYVICHTPTPRTVEFIRWTTQVIKKAVINQINPIKGEEKLSLQMALLASRTPKNIIFERSVIDHYASTTDRHGFPRTRRYDALELLGRVVRVYEFKKGLIDASDIHQTIDKYYLELAKLNICKKRSIDLVFVGTGITELGQANIDRYNAKDYRDFNVGDVKYRARIRFQSYYELANEWYSSAKKLTPLNAQWHLDKDMSELCPDVFSEHQLKQFESNQFKAPRHLQICEAA